MGYERTELVRSRCQCIDRGGVVDNFPMKEDHPIRIDRFDTEIDSIRYFDPENQRSLEMIDHIHISPATELLLSKEERVAAADKLETSLANTLKKLDRKSTRLNSSHVAISYAVFCLKKKTKQNKPCKQNK